MFLYTNMTFVIKSKLSNFTFGALICTHDLRKMIVKKREVKEKTNNPMREIKIQKLCLDICVGESSERLN